MMRSYWLLLILGGLFMMGCQKKDDRSPKERYASALAEGLASDERTDETLLGIQLGWRPKSFFDHCTELNKRKLIDIGTEGLSVAHVIKDLDQFSATMNFYPDFSEPGEAGRDSAIIVAMDFSIRYDAWSPWNQEMDAMHLLRDVTGYFVDRFGDDFIAVPHDKLGRVVTQVKNNRRTTLWIKDKLTVAGRITDLSARPDEPLVVEDTTRFPLHDLTR